MNFLGMGPMEILVILIIALMVFGPSRLPEIMGQAGKAIQDFRRATSELSNEFNQTIQAELAEAKAIAAETKDILNETKSALAEATTETRSMLNEATTLAAGEPLAAPESASAPVPAPELTSTPGVNGEAAGSTNGADSAPALVDTTQSWAWETAASQEERAADAAAATPAPAVDDYRDELPSTEPVAVTTSSSESSARKDADDLLPPY